jgi:hypothetical protein
VSLRDGEADQYICNRNGNRTICRVFLAESVVGSVVSLCGVLFYINFLLSVAGRFYQIVSPSNAAILEKALAGVVDILCTDRFDFYDFAAAV